MYLDNFEDLALYFLRHYSFLAAVFLLILEEAGFPLPVSDLVIMYMGFQVSKGRISFITIFLILMVADLIGASILYYLSYKYGRILVDQFGKYLHLDTHKLKIIEEKFKKHGLLFIIIGRHIPGLRVPITVFAGMSEITYKTFLFATFLSVVWWIPFYLYVGEKLGRRTIQLFHNHAGYSVVLALLTAAVIIGFFWFLRKKK